ncbi:hypothetical protein II898_05225 [bacterium]|nr:hypothetical protein [bacterium]
MGADDFFLTKIFMPEQNFGYLLRREIFISFIGTICGYRNNTTAFSGTLLSKKQYFHCKNGLFRVSYA